MSRWWIPLFLVTLRGGPAPAQQVPQPGSRLTLEQALELARDNNPAYAAHRARLQAADAQERSTAWWLRILPTVSLTSGISVTQSRVLTGTDEFGRPIRLDDPISYRRTDSDFGPYIGQMTLFDGGASIRDARSTRAGVRGTRAGVAAETLQLEAQLVRSYYAVVQLERQAELETRLLRSARLNLEAAERLLRIGAQDPLDLLGAELAVAEAEGRLDGIEGDIRRARLTLADAMGLPSQTDFALADSLPPIFDPSRLDPDELVAAALMESPAIDQVEASAEQSRYALLDARMSRWPTISATLSTRRGTSLGSGSDALFYLDPRNQTYTLGVNVSLSLFDRFQGSSRVAQARASHAAATENLRLRSIQIESDVRGAILDLENISRSIALLERTSELSRQRMELSEESYRLGLLNFSQLQTAVDAAYQAEYAALSARFDFVRALLALEEATGLRIR